MILGTRSNRISMAMANEVLKRMRERFPGEPVELKIQTGEGKPSEAASGNQTTWEYGQLLEGLRSGGIDAAAVGVDLIVTDPVRMAIARQAPPEEILAAAVDGAFVSLARYLRFLLKNGLTVPGEVLSALPKPAGS